MMRYVLNELVVCGNEKNCYQTSCFTKKDGTKIIKSVDIDIALGYKYLYYGTTFKRNNIKIDEFVKCLIIDVDYKFVKSLEQAHNIVAKNILEPTFTTKTDKGYQFMFALGSSFMLNKKGESYLRAINQELMNKFKESGIDIDIGASSRLISTYRNPLVHNHIFRNITYSVQTLSKKLNLNSNRSPKKHLSSTKIHLNNKNESSKSYEQHKKQKAVLDKGFVDGNRNEYFYLYANKECVLQNANTENDFIMICNMVADNISVEHPNIEPLKNNEIKATAMQLHRYRNGNNSNLYMPTVFGGTKRDINEGRYRNELNAVLGYTDLKTRRSKAMEFVQRDRKAKTLNTIKKAINKLSMNDYTSIYTITKKLSVLSGLSISTIKRYLTSNPSLLANSLSGKKKNVIDFMNLLKTGVKDTKITNQPQSNNKNYTNITKPSNNNVKVVYEYVKGDDLCISEATKEQIRIYERMGWELLPF